MPSEEEVQRLLRVALEKAAQMVSHKICLNCCNLEMVWEERIYCCSYRLVPRGDITAFIESPFEFVTELTEEELRQVCPGYNPHHQGLP